MTERSERDIASLQLNLKDVVGLILIVGGLLSSFFIGRQTSSQNTRDIEYLKARVESLEGKSDTVIRLEERIGGIEGKMNKIESQTEEIYRILVGNTN